MGLASRQKPDLQRVDALDGVAITETIDMKESLRLTHAPGVVAVLDSFPSDDPQSFVGRIVRIRTPEGRELVARADAVRNHITTISFFFRD